MSSLDMIFLIFIFAYTNIKKLSLSIIRILFFCLLTVLISDEIFYPWIGKILKNLLHTIY